MLYTNIHLVEYLFTRLIVDHGEHRILVWCYLRLLQSSTAVTLAHFTRSEFRGYVAQICGSFKSKGAFLVGIKVAIRCQDVTPVLETLV